MYYKKSNLVGLRTFSKNDFELYSIILDDEQTTKYMEMGDRPTSEKILDNTYKEANFDDNSVVFSVDCLENKKFIGTTGLYLINWVARRAQFRVLIGGEKNIQNKWYGTEITKLIVEYGFKRLNLELIYLGVNEKNIAAIKVYKKAGFIEEGKIRKFVYNNGIYYDSINMSITKEDFQNSKIYK